MSRHDDINSKMVAYATVLSCVLLFVIVQLVSALTYNLTNSQEERTLANSEYKHSSQMISEQRQTLDGYKWVQPPAEESADAPKPEKKLHIPIQRTEEVVLEEVATAKT